MTDLIFVYGTLRKGMSNSLERWEGVEFVGPGTIHGSIYDLGWYPGVVLDGSGTVHGEVWRVKDQSIMAALDAYEGYPSLYDRSIVLTGSGRHVWVYTYNHAVKPDQRIVSGDWVHR